MAKNVIVIGGGGHAKVIIDCIRLCGDCVVGVLDDNPAACEVFGAPVLGKICEYKQFATPETEFVIAIGNAEKRKNLAETLDLPWYTAIHPTAVVSQYSEIGAGSVVFAKAVVNAAAKVGKHCILNTGSVVEHDDVIGDYVHIAPNTALGGTVRIGDSVFIGIGSSVKNNITVCSGSIIGAGAAVVRDITEKGVYAGVPARRLR